MRLTKSIIFVLLAIIFCGLSLYHLLCISDEKLNETLALDIYHIGYAYLFLILAGISLWLSGPKDKKFQKDKETSKHIFQIQMDLVELDNALTEAQNRLSLAIKDREGYKLTLKGVREELNRAREELIREKEFNEWLITENEMKS